MLIFAMRYVFLILALFSLTACGPKPTAYPLNKCLISGETLGAHGEPFRFVRDGQEVKLCCEACLEDFNKNAAKLMPKITAALPPK